MANSDAEMGSDAAQVSGGDYQVFLSFRGLDTRHGFTDFLYDDLVDAGVRVFRDDDELRVGEVIGENLLKAINNSTIYIPVFSHTYASSKWCLRELAHIVDNESKSEGKKIILPIFFHVEPEDVKLRTSLYSNAVLEHKEKFPEEVEAWSEALAKVGKIKGWNVEKNQSQPRVVALVVKRVLEELKIKQTSVTKHLVGHDQLENLKELLHVNHGGVRLIGIYGMGGIGKTTIAKVIFNQLCSHFGKRCSFLDGVRERSSKEGIVQPQKKLLSDIVDTKSAEEVKDSEGGMRRIREIFPTKKVLVVLDDVDKKEHIMKLIGNSRLHPGSRIIITTRDTSILQVEEFEDEIQLYEMLKMDDSFALQLFSRHAFGRDFPWDVYRELSSEIVSRMGGLPLAIEVVGSLLKGKNEAFWKETLARLKKEPEEEILKKLRISYDDLDKYHKQIFLDIACFFFNEKKTDAIYMWANCSFYPERGMDVLTSRCLIKILDDDKFWMHDLLIDMGRQIVREESQYDLGKRSRLWIAKEALQIIGTQERKHEIQALEIDGLDGSIEITNEDFERLPNLRFLNLNGGTYAGDFAKCCSNLRWFSWHSPRDFRADKLYLDRLVVCKLNVIDFKDDSKAWDLMKNARDLKILSITRCHGITTIPDISKCSGLERLTLERCSRLKRIGSFIECLPSLIELKIEDCWEVTDLPEEIGVLVNLKHFSLSRCVRLRELPSSMGNLTSLTELDLSDTAIRELPSSIGIGKLSSLKILNLKSTNIRGIPRTINMLHHLQTLNLMGCHQIEELPELPTSLTCLYLHSKSLISVPNLSNLSNLVELLLSNDSGFEKQSNLITGCYLRWIERLSSLKKLELNLLNVPAPPELASLSHLEKLVLRHLDPVQLPSSDWSLRNLSTLDIGYCEIKDIPLERLPRLEKLHVECCKRLERLSIPLELRKLWQVDVSRCRELVEIQVVGASTSLENLNVYKCKSLRRINGLSYLKNLETLRIGKCTELTNVEGLNELQSLKSLKVWGCPSLRSLINASCTKIPDECVVFIKWCGDFIENFTTPSFGTSLKHYGEQTLMNRSNKIQDRPEFDISGPDEVSDSAYVGESKSDGTAEFFEATGIRRRKRDGRIGRYDCVDEGKTASMENRKKDKDEIREPANPSDVAGSSRQTCEGVEHYERSYKVPTEIEDQDEIQESAKPSDAARSSRQTCEGVEHNERSSKVTTEIEDPRELSSVELVTSQMEHLFTIDFTLKIKQLGDVPVTLRRKKNVARDLVTYEGLIAEVKGFGFLVERMSYKPPDEDRELLIEIKSDEQVQGMMELASQRGLVCLVVEGGVENSLKGVIGHFLAFFFCVAFFLFLWLLPRKLDFPRKIEQLARMRGFSLYDFGVIFVLLLFLFFGFNNLA